jgi:3-methyladenine DNA glycosylase AlkD
MLNNFYTSLQNQKNPDRASASSRFFKTGKGEYGEGDIFIGLTVPASRKLAIEYSDLPIVDITILLQSKIHEERLIALLILVNNFQKGDENVRQEIYAYYLNNRQYVNNWDLVDLSAPKIVGEYLRNQKDKSILIKLAKSESMWDKRIAMLATFQFIIKDSNCVTTFEIATILISDKNDLIQKAVGWMLREVGKRISEKKEKEYLKKYYKSMGRTALRYAIERFDEDVRRKNLYGKI